MADHPKADKADTKEHKSEKGAKEAKGEKSEKRQPASDAKKMDFGPDFRYLVRIVNTDLDGKKPLTAALTYVPGVSHRMAGIVAREAELDPNARIGTLNDAQLATLVETLEAIDQFVPVWMQNRRNDVESGEDRHMVGAEITIMLREDLNRLKKIRSWRGHRHEKKLPTRGQRTKNNGRFGGAVGVQRKAEGQPAGDAAAAPAAAGGKPAAAAPKAQSAAQGAQAKAAAAPAKPSVAGGGAKPLAGGKK